MLCWNAYLRTQKVFLCLTQNTSSNTVKNLKNRLKNTKKYNDLELFKGFFDHKNENRTTNSTEICFLNCCRYWNNEKFLLTDLVFVIFEIFRVKNWIFWSLVSSVLTFKSVDLSVFPCSDSSTNRSEKHCFCVWKSKFLYAQHKKTQNTTHVCATHQHCWFHSTAFCFVFLKLTLKIDSQQLKAYGNIFISEALFASKKIEDIFKWKVLIWQKRHISVFKSDKNDQF